MNSTTLLGYIIIFGGAAFVLMYAVDPVFRNEINQMIMGKAHGEFPKPNFVDLPT